MPNQLNMPKTQILGDLFAATGLLNVYFIRITYLRTKPVVFCTFSHNLELPSSRTLSSWKVLHRTFFEILPHLNVAFDQIW